MQNRVLDLRRLQIDADLECELNGNAFRIRNVTDRKIVCELPNGSVLFDLRTVFGKAVPLRKVGRLLNQAEQSVEVQVAGKRIARFGIGADSSFLKLVGLRFTELDLWAIAKLGFKP